MCEDLVGVIRCTGGQVGGPGECMPARYEVLLESLLCTHPLHPLFANAASRALTVSSEQTVPSSQALHAAGTSYLQPTVLPLSDTYCLGAEQTRTPGLPGASQVDSSMAGSPHALHLPTCAHSTGEAFA